MNWFRFLISMFGAVIVSCLAPSQAAAQADSPKSSDPTQSFVSPLGLGTGATLAVTQKGTSITAALASQKTNAVFNFWQAGFSGTTNTNGQAEVYSTQDSDAPGFKAKVGVGKASFITNRVEYHLTSTQFRLQAWCRDLVDQVNKSLPASGQTHFASTTSCAEAVAAEMAALTATPPQDGSGKTDTKAQEQDQLVLLYLQPIANTMTPIDQNDVCQKLKGNADFLQFCPGGKSYADVTREQERYPNLDIYTRDAPSEFQWTVWANWIPVVTSTPYRPVVNGVTDLSSKQNWTGFMNSGVGDLALYYGRLTFGAEGGYGRTVQIKQQNVCLNTVSGSYTAQQCSMAMLGKPVPKNSWTSSAALQVMPITGKNTGLTSGAQALFSYSAPSAGGHSSELALPFYISPSASRLSFVVGIQPTWDWNTDPMAGNKFAIAVFAGARPGITKN